METNISLKLLPFEQVKNIQLSAAKRIADNEEKVVALNKKISDDKELLQVIESYINGMGSNKDMLGYDKEWTYKEKIKFVFKNMEALGITYIRAAATLSDIISKLDESEGNREAIHRTISPIFSNMINKENIIKKVNVGNNLGFYYELIEQ